MKNTARFILLLLAGLGTLSCAGPARMAPADFAVLSLKATPQEIDPGQKVQVTAEVTNTGGLPGNFDLPLMVNGSESESKVVTLQPNATKSLSYTVEATKPGPYTLALGNTTAKFRVRLLAEQEMELKYDSGKSRDALWAGNGGGFLIDFDPSAKAFTLDRVSVCGGIYGSGWEGKSFELYVLGSDLKSILYHEVFPIDKFPVKGAFPYQAPSWVDFEIPPVQMNGKFYVYLYTSEGKHKGIQVGADDSVPNEHSELGQGKPPGVARVTMVSIYLSNFWYSDQSHVNWMIRAYGTSLVRSN
jgi:hypothetical protein